METAAAQAALAVVDAASSTRVLVLGPTRGAPAGVDIVCRGVDRAAIESALAGAGFAGRRMRWARFDGPGLVVVTVIDGDAWSLPREVVDQAFGRAAPWAGRRFLARPELADELLILCRRVDELPLILPADRRRWLNSALVADATAWVTASRRAPQWRVVRTLDVVKAAADVGEPITATDRRRAAAERGERAGSPAAGVVVALSGLDGAGKSTQARALAATLGELGYEVSLRWSRLAFSPLLAALAALPKYLLGWVHRSSPAKGSELRLYRGARGEEADSLPTATDVAARRLRARWPVVHRVWTVLVALVNGGEQRRSTRRLLRAGTVVVCDRYVLDSLAHLRHSYGDHGRSAAAERLVRRLSPRPAVAILLELPAAEAFRRKPEEYDVEALEAQSRFYREVAQELGAHILDARRPPEQLAQLVAALVWPSLP